LSVQQANGAFTGVTEWVKTVVNAARFTQPLLEDVLGRVPVVCAGFLAVSFCLSGAKTLCDVVADRQYVAEVTSEINFLAGHAVMEMMSAAKFSPDDGELSLRQLAPIMGNIEKASSTLDVYIVSNVAANAMRGTQLGPLLNELRSVGRELVSLKSYRNLQKIGARQETDMVATHERLDGLREDFQALTLSTPQGGNGVEKDEFTPTFNVPDVPDGVHLDFSLDGFGVPTSMEGRLKAAVMKHDAREAQSVAAVGSDTKYVKLASVGMGGVGKTCALNDMVIAQNTQLLTHSNISSSFPPSTPLPQPPPQPALPQLQYAPSPQHPVYVVPTGQVGTGAYAPSASDGGKIAPPMNQVLASSLTPRLVRMSQALLLSQQPVWL
jgi:hypothetical protein